MVQFQALSSELLLQIVSHLGQHSSPPLPQDMVTLATLARVCRRFSDPALNMIWKHLPSIIPLILTMPRDLWIIEPSEGRGGHLKLVVRAGLHPT